MIVTAPGGAEARLAVERAVRARVWWQAWSPAQANMLVVAGDDHRFEPYVLRVWQTLPIPRVRVDVRSATDADQRLVTALSALHDVDRQRDETESGAGTEDQMAHATADRPDATDHGEHGGHADHVGHDMGHGGHDHHMSGMELPGGVAMADRAPDRDGLMLDQLHLPLGPALPLWPEGLVLHTRIQGDVIQRAEVELLTSPAGSYWSGDDSRLSLARRLDSCSRLLALSGWADAAVGAQRLRDDVLAGVPDERAIQRWANRVRRSRTLRWLLAGLGPAPDAPDAVAGDAIDRLYRRLDVTEAPDEHATQWTVENLPALLEGVELANARLIVASLDPDVALLAAGGVHHG